MKRFSERNPAVIGMIGVGLTAAITAGALQYKELPFFNSDREYSAYFAEAGGLKTGAAVQVAGLRVGAVDGIDLDGARVRITFKVDKDVSLGDRAEAAVKTKSLLGAKILEITPRGGGDLSAAIPIERTTSAYQLPDALGDLATTVSGLNTNQLNDSLSTLAQTFQNTAPDLQKAVQGAARFSQTIDERDAQLRGLLQNASKATGVLAKRSDEVVRLITETNALLAQLQTQSAALDHLSGNISALSKQVSGLIADNRETLRPSLEKLNGVLTILDNHKEKIQKSIKLLNSYAMSLGESVASGPYFKAILANLLPGQFIQPFVDAAFSDLGLDPNVLLPSQRFDPQIGQPATPALPLPMPRTGQGGDPHLFLPDAITGNPGDPRYPYREPLPAPPPGGPPPGPPALPAPASAPPVPALCPPCPAPTDRGQ
ncbi:MCE family protein [Mycobacterium sherrisii]|uniref:MCE family protein n=1 Tax=Mycobacterium sherrisii TaxID=243061 RepID=UPI000A154087|nr:MCE family protein [Mycobacterium sherrisii]MCV7032304.1 MCE family protein [Mycobacterium sherrisii]MEC4764271.1 MCE family protein [Mycobacterium sherrisii]ORW74558.1 mammalian cell entry protein [Mycobacterium sherrisii]